MPLHDFECPACGTVKADVYLPITQRAGSAEIACPACEQRAARYPIVLGIVLMRWIPKVGRMDFGGGSFQTFDAPIRQPDGSYVWTKVDSLHKLRQIERETEQAARNGEGEALRFRMWSNDDSNGDVNAFGDAPDVLAKKELERLQREAGDRRRGRLDTIRGEQARLNAETLGPGVTEDTTGALTELV